MKYKLIAFDLDGTFLDNRKNIPPRNLEAVTRAAEAGIHIVPSTGRIFGGIPESIRALPFIRYFLAINGAYVYDRTEDRTLYTADISAQKALQVMEFMDGFDGIYDCYKDNWGYMTRSMYEKADEYVADPGNRDLVVRLRKPVDDLKDMIRADGGPLQKLQIHFKDPAERLRALAALKETFPELNVTSSVSSNIEMNSFEADKGRALTALCNALGFSVSEAVAFGDGTNDVGMIRTAGLGVAMENGTAEAKAAADLIAGTNENAGVADVIEEILSGQK